MASPKSESLFIPQLTMFLLFTGLSLNSETTKLMIWHKTCLSNGYEKETCEHLYLHTEVEDDVQKKSASLSILVALLGFLPAAFTTLFWGSFSDVYGRKVILIIPPAACAISALGMLFQSFQVTLSPGLLYSASLLVGLSGSLSTFMSTMISYVMDTTPPERRTERMGLILPMVALGITVGTLCSGILWEQTGPSVIYFMIFISNVIIFISVLYMEEVAKTTDDDGKNQRVLSMGGLWRNVTAGFRVVSSPRQNGHRRKLLLLLIIGPAAVLIPTAHSNVVALHVRREPFQWSPSTLSYFAATKTGATVLGTALLAPLYNKVTGSKSDQGDLTMIGIGFCMSAVNCLVWYFASSPLHLLFVPLLVAFMGPTGGATRSLASNLVHPSEIGALNGFTSFINNISVTIVTVLMTSMYRETAHIMPGAAFLTSMTLSIILVFILLYLKNVYYTLSESDEKKSS